MNDSLTSARMPKEEPMSDLISSQVILNAFDNSTFTYDEICRRLLLVLSPQSHLKADRIDAFNECAAAVKKTN